MVSRVSKGNLTWSDFYRAQQVTAVPFRQIELALRNDGGVQLKISIVSAVCGLCFKSAWIIVLLLFDSHTYRSINATRSNDLRGIFARIAITNTLKQ